MADRTPIRRDQLAGFLYGIGTLDDTPDNIANDLALCGYTGIRHSPDGCPLAQLLTDLARRQVLVGHRTATLLGPRGGSQTVPLPRAAQQFVGDFDAGAYPGLVA